MGGKYHGGKRMSLDEARSIAFEVMFKFAEVGVVAWPCGSIRRMKEEVGDIDLLLLESDQTIPGGLESVLIELFGTQKSNKKKGAKSGLYRGAQIDCLVARRDAVGTAMMHWTGSKRENVRLRNMARSKGWKMSQHGVFDADGVNLAANMNEPAVYELLGAEFVEPHER